MPKKPISITLTTNQSIILCADKFGDVYSLPLFESLVKNTRQVDGFSKLGKTENTPAKPFTPSATALTVHTKSNQEALQHQQRVSNKAPEKNKLDFDHQLLLGHVSLLIDVVYVTLKTDLPELSRSRDYILTSDRDEHIRVSRGLRQAHIIEGYCLGHSQFVSKLCIPPWRQELLLSGGGDDYLLVWDWVSGVVRQKVDLAAHVATVKATFDRTTPVTGASKPLDSACGTRSEETALIAVSGIWAVQPASEESSGEVVVSIEG
jgi:tRNA (guanine-N(7)-)-methyltransferase subunit TRM82